MSSFRRGIGLQANKCSGENRKKWQLSLEKNLRYVIIRPLDDGADFFIRFFGKRGGDFVKNFVKIILYAYPLLKTVEKDYEEHIANKALLSYDGRWTAEQTAEYLAKEIIEMRRLEWLKGKVKRVLDKLTEEERALVEVRYFRKNKNRLSEVCREKTTGKLWSERKYFRRQERLSKKLEAMVKGVGLTEETFQEEFANTELIDSVRRFVERKENQYSSVS